MPLLLIDYLFIALALSLLLSYDRVLVFIEGAVEGDLLPRWDPGSVPLVREEGGDGENENGNGKGGEGFWRCWRGRERKMV